MKQVHSIRFNFLMNFILTASSFVFPLITFPYVSRVLMPEGIGKVTFATSVISYFTMVAMLGVPTYGIRACAQVRDDKEKLSKVVQELMIINLVLTLICYVCLGISICTIDRFREDSDIIWISSLGILLNAVGVNWFYSAIEEYSYITFRSLIFKVLSVFLMFFCIKDQDDYPMYAVMTLVASSGSYVLNFIRLRKYIFFKRYPHYDFMPHIKAAMVFFAMTVATTVYTNLDTVMLGFMSGNAEVGYYNAAVKVKQILVSLVTSLGAVLLPRLSYYVQSDRREQFYRVVVKAMRIVFFLAIPLMVFFMMFAEEVILILSGEAYLAAVPPMQIIMPTLLFIGITNLLGLQIMVPMGQERLVVISVVVGGILDLILNAVLIPGYGASGAAIGTLAAEGMVLVVQVVMLREVLRDMPRLQVWKVILATAAASIVVYYLQSMIQTSMMLVHIGIMACVFGVVYAGVAFILREAVLLEDILPGLRRR